MPAVLPNQMPTNGLPQVPHGRQSDQPPGRCAKNLRHVFVYGTLRQGGTNDITRMLPAPVYLGRASVAGQMFHLGAYPGVLLAGSALPTQSDSAGGTVVGEIYAVTPEVEAQLDELEEVYPQQRDEYFKREVMVSLAAPDEPGRPQQPVLSDVSAGLRGTALSCIVYEINPRYVAGRAVVASGDWIRDSGN